MQSAQINSPRFAYQTAIPAAETLDDFRVVRGNYAGSFSGKSKQPLWIAAAMIAAVGGIALGVNLYAGHNAVTLSPKAFAPVSSLPTTPSPPASNPVVPAVAPMAKDTLPVAATRSPPDASGGIDTVTPKRSATAKSTVLTPKKVAPLSVVPANKATPPLQEVAPPVQEPLPAPIPITEEKLVVPAPAPIPDAPPVEPPKL